MQRRRLGASGLVVSDICMGTMTFGGQCDEPLSHEICDRAWDAGIDFFDAAEIYPVPPKEELVGVTEQIVGRWMKTKSRDSVVIATKVTGPGHGWFTPPVREGKTCLDRRQIVAACEASLKRLGTDYIDLYRSIGLTMACLTKRCWVFLLNCVMPVRFGSLAAAMKPAGD